MSSINEQTFPIILKETIRQKLNLQAKATILAIAIGVIPVALVGTIAYQLTNNSLTKQIEQGQLSRSKLMTKDLSFFFRERFHEIDYLASLPMFTDAQLRETTTIEQKQATLKNFGDKIPIYDEISYASLATLTEAEKKEEYIEQAIQTKKITINQIKVAEDDEEFTLEYAAPIIDSQSDRVVGILQLTIDQDALYLFLETYTNKQDEWQIINEEGFVFAGVETDELEEAEEEEENYHLEKPIGEYFPEVGQWHANREIGIKVFYNQLEKSKELISYVPVTNESQELIPSLGVIIKTDTEDSFASSIQLSHTLILGTFLVTFGISFLAIYLANRATRPLREASLAVTKLGQGELDTRLIVEGEDELGILAHNINQMAEQIQQLLEEQKSAVQQQLEAQTEITNQEKKYTQKLQAELFQFLNNIEGASSGDLTVRAEINEGEIGIVADFFNSIIESLRDIVLQVKEATSKVNTSVGDNEISIRQVAQETLEQANQIAQTLNAVEEMTHSIQQVADNAKLAAEVSQNASRTAANGGEAIDKTVQSILQLRETVAATAKKVKRLGESSQEISKVVSLINQIAMQTNMLAINASIEASRAGEEGRGFAVVAEEVGELAIKSAEATKEIEEIVETIQEETAEVVKAMEVGTAQVVEGTRLVEDTKLSLDQIVEVSRQIDLLLQSISTTTVSQAKTSSAVSQLMEKIAQVSERTSTASARVSQSLEETVTIAEQLQASVGTFKV
jgi:twitching motility protein PilJ